MGLTALRRALTLLVAVSMLTAALPAAPALAIAYVVNSAADPGDGVCDGAECTLREAIAAANASAGADTISFAIPAETVPVIAPLTGLPAVTDPLTIDGTTQLGGWVALDGGAIVSRVAQSGLELAGGGSLVRGLIIRSFPGSGIRISGPGGNTVAGNRIGTDFVGGFWVLRPNRGSGVLISGSPGNTIGGTAIADRNILSGNAGSGVTVEGAGADGNSILGSYIGLGGDGTSDVRNDRGGVRISSANNTVRGNVISANNLVGLESHGVVLDGAGATGNTIAGNLIGPRANGTAGPPNVGSGVLVRGGASNNTIGGLEPADRNVISNNREHGVHIADVTSTGNLIQGNYVGLAPDGAAAMPNGSAGASPPGAGILLSDLAAGVGTPGANTVSGNVVSGNIAYGIAVLRAPGAHSISGNLVGLAADGLTAVPNTSVGLNVYLGESPQSTAMTFESNTISGNAVHGMYLYGLAGATLRGNRIGLAAAGQTLVGNGSGGIVMLAGASNTVHGNEVAGNGEGILLGPSGGGSGSTANTLSENVIRANGGAGILLSGAATATNRVLQGGITGHPGKAISLLGGANGGIAAPVITGVSDGELFLVSGTARPGALVQVYADPDDEARDFLGQVSASALGNWTFSVDTPAVVTAVRAGTLKLRATQTDANSTSELSNAAPVPARPSGGIRGIAACGEGTIPGATVELVSGSLVLATTTANEDAFFEFTGVAANATYTIRIRGWAFEQLYVCGLTLTTDASGAARPTAGTSIPNRKNHTWPAAFTVQPGSSLTDYIFRSGQSTWFKFPIRPGQRATVKVTDVPANYSLALYKDIRALYLAQQALVSGGDPLAVAVIDASVAPDALSPDALSPDALSPDALSPDALSPDALSPDALSPDALSPDELSPDELSPDALSPDELSPDALSPDALSPDELSPDAYASAQTSALLGVSAHVGLSPEQISRNTWDNTGFFYVRVRGHNGAFDPARPFTLTVSVADSACTGATLPVFAPALPSAAGVSANGGPVRTLILTNSARLGSDPALTAKLATLAKHPRVNGLVIDLASQAGAAYAQWDAARTCPAAANAIAQGIRRLVLGHRAVDPIQHVVLVGGDAVIPFFRTPDQSGLGNERDYQPPVGDDTASQASLKLGYVLTQDPYAARVPFSRYDHELYIPDLGIGRLVETPAQIGAVIDAFLGSGGIVAPQRALVTGYDFLSDSALAMAADLGAAAVPTDATLVQPVGGRPTDPTAWTADQLRAKLFSGPRADIIALNGHFSANRALAADYATRLGSEEIAGAVGGRFRNTLVLSGGCHSGYNIVDGHAVTVTQPLDFAQAFALQGATLVGGTGYQYGDTDFIKYTELILTKLVRELRYGSGPVDVGAALSAAKRQYVREIPALRGIDEKALAVATLYGLPMTAVDLPAGRTSREGTPLAGSPTPLASAGLAALDWTPAYTLTRNERTLTDLGGTATSPAVYYDIAGNVAVAPGAPVLPVLAQDVSRTGAAARGVVLRSAQYIDEAGIRPFTDVATTEVRGAHARYSAPVFTPVRPFDLNHFAGTTLVATPFQFRGEDTGIGRRFTSQQLRIYYSSRTDAPAVLGGAPIVYSVRLLPAAGGVAVEVTAGAASAVGIEELFATYTAEAGSLYGSWSSLALVGGATSTNGGGFVRTYTGTIPLGAGDDPMAVRVLVQAAGGNGLVSWASNNGAFYRIVTETATAAAPKIGTALALTAPAGGTYLGAVPVAATLTSSGQPLAGKLVSFRAGGIRVDALTGPDGGASASLPLLAAPGAAAISVGFAEDATHLGSGAESPVAIDRAPSSLVAAAAAPLDVASRAVIATLRTAGGILGGQPITISGGGRQVASSTDGYGRVRLDTVDGFAPGAYTVTVAYDGNDRYAPAAPFSLSVRVRDVPVSVSGGGWIRTPSGEKATFSLKAKYTGGLESPKGHVKVKVGKGLSFRSVAIERVVRMGDRAEIEGTGTIGTTGGYRFRAVVVAAPHRHGDGKVEKDDDERKDRKNDKDNDKDKDESDDDDSEDQPLDDAPERFEIRIWDAASSATAPLHHFANQLGGGNVRIR